METAKTRTKHLIMILLFMPISLLAVWGDERFTEDPDVVWARNVVTYTLLAGYIWKALR